MLVAIGLVFPVAESSQPNKMLGAKLHQQCIWHVKSSLDLCMLFDFSFNVCSDFSTHFIILFLLLQRSRFCPIVCSQVFFLTIIRHLVIYGMCIQLHASRSMKIAVSVQSKVSIILLMFMFVQFDFSVESMCILYYYLSV